MMPKHFCWKQYTHISITLGAHIGYQSAQCAWIDCMPITMLAAAVAVAAMSITWLLILNSPNRNVNRSLDDVDYRLDFSNQQPDCLIVFTFFFVLLPLKILLLKSFLPVFHLQFTQPCRILAREMWIFYAKYEQRKQHKWMPRMCIT